MSHIHKIEDHDKHFIIDSITKKIQPENHEKNKLVRYDHNSERYTFEMNRMIEGHDMSLCDIVQIHYINISSSKQIKNEDIYEVNDLGLLENNNDKIVFTWLVSRNATALDGMLTFAIRFACSDGDDIKYELHTEIFSSISISNTIFNNGSTIVEEYSDILNQWKQELFSIEGVIQNAKTDSLNAIEELRSDTLESIEKNRVSALNEINDDVTNALKAIEDNSSSSLQAIDKNRISALKEINDDTVNSLKAIEDSSNSSLQAIDNNRTVTMESINTAKSESVKEITDEGIKQVENITEIVDGIAQDSTALQILEKENQSIEFLKLMAESAGKAGSLNGFGLNKGVNDSVVISYMDPNTGVLEGSSVLPRDTTLIKIKESLASINASLKIIAIRNGVTI